MNRKKLAELERALGLTLPREYRAALADYPLPRDPDSTELWLCDDVRQLVGLNRDWRADGQLPHLVVIGSDGGEKSYLLDTRSAPFPVMVYSVESGTLKRYSSSFVSFLHRQRQEFEAVQSDARRKSDAYARRHWWQFWKRRPRSDK